MAIQEDRTSPEKKTQAEQAPALADANMPAAPAGGRRAALDETRPKAGPLPVSPTPPAPSAFEKLLKDAGMPLLLGSNETLTAQAQQILKDDPAKVKAFYETLTKGYGIKDLGAADFFNLYQNQGLRETLLLHKDTASFVATLKGNVDRIYEGVKKLNLIPDDLNSFKKSFDQLIKSFGEPPTASLSNLMRVSAISTIASNVGWVLSQQKQFEDSPGSTFYRDTLTNWSKQALSDASGFSTAPNYSMDALIAFSKGVNETAPALTEGVKSLKASGALLNGPLKDLASPVELKAFVDTRNYLKEAFTAYVTNPTDYTRSEFLRAQLTLCERASTGVDLKAVGLGYLSKPGDKNGISAQVHCDENLSPIAKIAQRTTALENYSSIAYTAVALKEINALREKVNNNGWLQDELGAAYIPKTDWDQYLNDASKAAMEAANAFKGAAYADGQKKLDAALVTLRTASQIVSVAERYRQPAQNLDLQVKNLADDMQRRADAFKLQVKENYPSFNVPYDLKAIADARALTGTLQREGRELMGSLKRGEIKSDDQLEAACKKLEPACTKVIGQLGVCQDKFNKATQNATAALTKDIETDLKGKSLREIIDYADMHHWTDKQKQELCGSPSVPGSINYYLRQMTVGAGSLEEVTKWWSPPLIKFVMTNGTDQQKKDAIETFRHGLCDGFQAILDGITELEKVQPILVLNGKPIAEEILELLKPNSKLLGNLYDEKSRDGIALTLAALADMIGSAKDAGISKYFATTQAGWTTLLTVRDELKLMTDHAHQFEFPAQWISTDNRKILLAETHDAYVNTDTVQAVALATLIATGPVAFVGKAVLQTGAKAVLGAIAADALYEGVKKDGVGHLATLDGVKNVAMLIGLGPEAKGLGRLATTYRASQYAANVVLSADSGYKASTVAIKMFDQGGGTLEDWCNFGREAGFAGLGIMGALHQAQSARAALAEREANNNAAAIQHEQAHIPVPSDARPASVTAPATGVKPVSTSPATVDMKPPVMGGPPVKPTPAPAAPSERPVSTQNPNPVTTAEPASPAGSNPSRTTTPTGAPQKTETSGNTPIPDSPLPDGVRESGNRRAVYYQNKSQLQDRYAQCRAEELAAEQGLAEPTKEMIEQAKKESKEIAAFVDPKTGQIISPELIGVLNTAERRALAAQLVHEDLHTKGAGEFESWKAEAEKLAKLGLEMDLSGRFARIREVGEGKKVEIPSDEQIRDFIGKTYTSGSAIAAAAARKVGLTRKTGPDTEWRNEITAAVTEAEVAARPLVAQMRGIVKTEEAMNFIRDRLMGKELSKEDAEKLGNYTKEELKNPGFIVYMLKEKGMINEGQEQGLTKIVSDYKKVCEEYVGKVNKSNEVTESDRDNALSLDDAHTRFFTPIKEDITSFAGLRDHLTKVTNGLVYDSSLNQNDGKHLQLTNKEVLEYAEKYYGKGSPEYGKIEKEYNAERQKYIDALGGESSVDIQNVVAKNAFKKDPKGFRAELAKEMTGNMPQDALAYFDANQWSRAALEEKDGYSQMRIEVNVKDNNGRATGQSYEFRWHTGRASESNGVPAEPPSVRVEWHVGVGQGRTTYELVRISDLKDNQGQPCMQAQAAAGRMTNGAQSPPASVIKADDGFIWVKMDGNSVARGVVNDLQMGRLNDPNKIIKDAMHRSFSPPLFTSAIETKLGRNFEKGK